MNIFKAMRISGFTLQDFRNASSKADRAYIMLLISFNIAMFKAGDNL